MFRFLMARQRNTGGTALFMMGYTGVGTGLVSATEKYDFASEARSNGTTITSPIFNYGLTSNRQHAFMAGGFDWVSNLSTVRKYKYSDDVVSNSASLINAARRSLVGFSSTSAAFFAGGFISTGTNVVDGLLYSNETMSSKTSLSSSRYGGGTFTDNASGYFSGGVDGVTVTARNDKYSFSGNSWSTASALLLPRDLQAVCGSISHGYNFSGRNSTPLVATIEKYNLSTAVVDYGTSIATPRGDSTCSSNAIKAIITGGSTTAPPTNTATTSCEIYYFNNNSIATGNSLTTARMVHGFGSASSSSAYL